jgi:hypothetical protein
VVELNGVRLVLGSPGRAEKIKYRIEIRNKSAGDKITSGTDSGGGGRLRQQLFQRQPFLRRPRISLRVDFL